MHPLLAAYSLAGGDARKLSDTLGVPAATAGAWLRDAGADGPDAYLVRIEAAAVDQIQEQLAKLRDEAAGDADPFSKRGWRERIRDLDRAHWLVYEISLFEFQFRVLLNLAKAEGGDHVSV